MTSAARTPINSWRPAEKAALRYGRRVTRDASVPDDAFADLRRHFDEGEIVEITCVLALFTYFNRFKEALRVEPDSQED